jgi:hypothetical protein
MREQPSLNTNRPRPYGLMTLLPLCEASCFLPCNDQKHFPFIHLDCVFAGKLS